MADLHTLLLLFRDGQRQVTLIYSSESAARVDYENVVKNQQLDIFTLTDSFGTTITTRTQAIEAVILQHNGKAHEGGVEMALLQARAQAHAERRAASDPMLGKRMVQVGQPGFKM